MNTMTKLSSKDTIKDKKILKFQILSPIHIGTRDGKLSAFEFVTYKNKVHIIDENRFGAFLKKKNLIDCFMLDAPKIRHVSKFLENRNLNVADTLPEITCRAIYGGSSAMNDFRAHMRDAYGQVFIPGTSIKGVIRTAILYKMLSQDENLAEDVKQHTIKNLSQGRLSEWRKKYFSSDWLQKERLQKFYLPDGKEGPNQDIFRCLTVRDAYPVEGYKTEVIKLMFLSKGANGKHYFSQQKYKDRSTGKDLELWVEAVTDGVFETELIWDYALFNEFKSHNNFLPFEGIEDCISAVEQFSNDVIDKNEMKFYEVTAQGMPKYSSFKDLSYHLNQVSLSTKCSQSINHWYKQQTSKMFRIGFGSGMLSTTVNALFDEGVRQKIRNICGHQRGNDPAPKSRRVWQKSTNQWMPMGWMALKIDKQKVTK